MIEENIVPPIQVSVLHPAFQEKEESWEQSGEAVWKYSLHFSHTCGMTEGKGIMITWKVPILDILYRWHPVCGTDRFLKADWDSPLRTMNAVSAPVVCMINGEDENRFTAALSETQKIVYMGAGVHEEDGTLLFDVTINAAELEKEDTYDIILYISREKIKLWQILDRVRQWWELENMVFPMTVPDFARYPMYSTWYSFHQDISDTRLEEEAARAKKLGFSTIIVDDGWQTNDHNRGYAFCGDWEPQPEKFPSIQEHVERIHQMGMKYMIWFSVPFLGIHAKRWKDFSDKIIWFDESRQAGVLDIRFPQIREYLLQFYKRAVAEWKVDGLKLDFIDEFYFRSDTAAEKEGITCRSVQEALELLLTEVTAELKKYNSDIMIEFRQRYIGPGIRPYGNIFRVSDCPESGSTNRLGIVDLRMLSGSTAIHSDMMMWNPDEIPEDIAIQLQNSIFATPQVSVCLESLSDRQRQTLVFWMKFCEEHMELLQKAQIMPQEAGYLYPVVRTKTEREELAAVYAPDKVITLDPAVGKHTIIWANKSEYAFIRMEYSCSVHICIRDCLGEVTEDKKLILTECQRLPVCPGGLLEISS